jgi:putative ABC transport system permease protein
VAPLAGRLFAPEHAADVMPPDADKIETPIHAGVILNATALKRLGFASAEAAVGRTFKVSLGEERKADVTVVGVIADLHLRSIHEAITPMLYYVADDPKSLYSILLRIDAAAAPAALAAIDRAWSEIIPEVPIQRAFVDDDFAALDEAEQERMKMFGAFALLAVFVACLGLFGLASFAADRRTREIGIRKVLGATHGNIVRLLLWQFSRPVLVANLLAWPVAWYFLASWLGNFPYRVALTPLPFLAAGLVALLVAWGTVFGHARRVASSEPVAALRYE